MNTLRRIRPHLPVEYDPSFIQRFETRDTAKDGGLAGTRGSEQDGDARRHVDIERGTDTRAILEGPDNVCSQQARLSKTIESCALQKFFCCKQGIEGVTAGDRLGTAFLAI